MHREDLAAAVHGHDCRGGLSVRREVLYLILPLLDAVLQRDLTHVGQVKHLGKQSMFY